MTQQNFAKFVHSFCSNDKLRVNMTKPTLFSDSLMVSTDAHVLLGFYTDKVGSVANWPENEYFKYDHDKKIGVNARPVVDSYIQQFFNNPEAKPIGLLDLSAIDKSIAEVRKHNIEYTYKYEDCPDCDGEGVEVCPCCDSEKDCKTCDGDGQVKAGIESERGVYRYPDNEVFYLKDLMFSFQVMDLISTNLKLIDKSALEIYTVANNRLFAKIHGTDMFIMAMSLITDSDTKEDKIFHKLELKTIDNQ